MEDPVKTSGEVEDKSIFGGVQETKPKPPEILPDHRQERRAEGKLHHPQHNHIDMDADTPVDAVKAPGCFNRIREEVEAIVENIAEKMHLKRPPS